MHSTSASLLHRIYFSQLIGIALLVIGIRGITDTGTYSNLFGTTNSLLVEAAAIVIAAGCVVIIIGFIGCYGAKEDSKFFLGMVRFFCVKAGKRKLLLFQQGIKSHNKINSQNSLVALHIMRHGKRRLAVL